MLTTSGSRFASSSAWFASTLSAFQQAESNSILGALARSSQFSDEVAQKQAWTREIELLKHSVAGIPGWLFLEFDIPRLGSRVDAVVISGGAVIPIEFKVGETVFRRSDIEQAWDYGLDLKNFHEASHHADVFPILVATEARDAEDVWREAHADRVRPPRLANAQSLRTAIADAIALADSQEIDGDAWGRAPYRPTPTIIQAARSLYARHTVEAISRSDAGATNLRVTSKRVEDIIDDAQRDKSKAIVFVTGVPGAGKTLVGLNIATRRSDSHEGSHAVYLSGNGPLVAVLRESLTRDEVARLRAAGEKPRKGTVAGPVKSFIQNVHHFRDEGLRSESTPPADHVVIFDESQRAWNLEQTRNFMLRRKGRAGFDMSEPQFLLAYMDRHSQWAVVVCLVGGGQEINTGEAGIGAWLDAVRDHFPTWKVYISPELGGSEYAAAGSLKRLSSTAIVSHDRDLHLAVSMRSFRAERVSGFVSAVLDTEIAAAQGLLHEFSARYPIVLTRELSSARQWIRSRARGSERFGLVASSQAMRLKPHAIDVRVPVDPVHYFLAERDDTRSSFYLEDAATEFHIQGLELDWVVMNWDADLRFTPAGWSHHAFRGDAWTNIHKRERQKYLVNAYRVLMTRARQGMVIFVPRGDSADHTRKPEFYDPTFEYLASTGIPRLP